ncbi:hypothetical protein D0869_08619 [Hortaea werneckii]|uniref:Uncharacterized protein n=1 Tax=Hortaea werneckii TaxID=91943 RepID=A0A3M6WKA9_HORWE|nr:hypothetical protein D0869_08619 [Hortaea werneckii]
MAYATTSRPRPSNSKEGAARTKAAAMVPALVGVSRAVMLAALKARISARRHHFRVSNSHLTACPPSHECRLWHNCRAISLTMIPLGSTLSSRSNGPVWTTCNTFSSDRTTTKTNQCITRWRMLMTQSTSTCQATHSWLPRRLIPMSCKSRPRSIRIRCHWTLVLTACLSCLILATAFPLTVILRSPRSWLGLQFCDTREYGSLPKPTSRLSRKTSAPKSDVMGTVIQIPHGE